MAASGTARCHRVCNLAVRLLGRPHQIRVGIGLPPVGQEMVRGRPYESRVRPYERWWDGPPLKRDFLVPPRAPTLPHDCTKGAPGPSYMVPPIGLQRCRVAALRGRPGPILHGATLVTVFGRGVTNRKGAALSSNLLTTFELAVVTWRRGARPGG